MTANRSRVAQPVDVDTETLRQAIKAEYKEVADHPGKGFHFHTGRRLTKIVGYRDEWFNGVSELAIESFAGTGNPYAMGELAAGERVVDVGSGGGIDSLIAARMVGPTGEVVGIDMTPAMLEKARAAAAESGIDNVEFREAYMEELPVHDGWAVELPALCWKQSSRRQWWLPVSRILRSPGRPRSSAAPRRRQARVRLAPSA